MPNANLLAHKTNCQLWLDELEALAPMAIHAVVSEEYPLPMTEDMMGVLGGSLCRSVAMLYGVDLDRVICRFSRDKIAGIVYLSCGIRLSS